jgi:hypothetical protein
MCLVGLGYLPIAHRNTMRRRQGVSLDGPTFLERRTQHIADLLLHLLGAPE